MRLFTFTLILAAGLAAFALRSATPGSSQDRLRSLIRLPRLNFSIVLSCDARTGYSFIWCSVASRTDVKALRRDMPAGLDGATRYRELGLLHLQHQAYDLARPALDESLRILNSLGAAQSSNPEVVADYARTLMLQGRFDEALREARRGGEIAADNWRTEAALARCLIACAVAEVVPTGVRSDQAAASAAHWSTTGAWKIHPGQAEKARGFAADALKAADRAVKLGDNESSAWLDRAVVKNLVNLVNYLIEVATGAEVPPARMTRSLFPRDSLDDLLHAARLAPQNARLLGAAGMYAVMTSVIERGVTGLGDLISGGAWPLLDESGRARLRADLSRLEQLGAGGHPTTAGAALEMLGMLQLLGTHDLANAEASFRQALQLDAGRDAAWEGLVALYVFAERFENLAALCEARLQVGDSARVRLLLAKACERTKDSAHVLAILEPAQRRFPDDFLLNLATALSLMRENPDNAVLARAAQLASRAEKLAGESPTMDKAVNLLLTRGLLLALLGQTEAAGDHLRRVLEIDASREDVREILQLIE